MNDVFQKYPIYETSDIITTANDVLIRGDLVSNPRLSYQKIASGITLKWQTTQLPVGSYSNSLVAANIRGYMRDEVYAFEVVFLLKNGLQTDSFHIPGRVAQSYDLTPVTNGDTNGATLPAWKVYNTALLSGEMGYYESEEVYPCDELTWGDLAGKPIRHHQMPDSTITHIHDDLGNIYPLGILIDIQQVLTLIQTSDLTNEEKNSIAGFKIVRGNRANNKSIVAKGIMRNVGQYTKDNTTYYFPNYPYNSVQQDPFITGTLYNSDSLQRFTFQSPDTTFYQPYLGNKLKFETVEFGVSTGHFQPVKNHSRYKIYTDGLYLTAIGAAGVIVGLSRWVVAGLVDGGTIIDGVPAVQIYQTLVDIFERTTPFINYVYQYNSVGNYDKHIVVPNNGDKVRNLDISQYIINGYASVADTHIVNNFNRESYVYLKTNTAVPYAENYPGVPTDNSRWTCSSEGICGNDSQVINKNINGYYASIKKPNIAQYNQIYSYQTVDTGFQYMIGSGDISPKVIYGGDVFINKFAFKTKLPFFIDDRINSVDGADIFYNELGNVGSPNYWYSSELKSQGGKDFLARLTGTLFGTKVHQLDCDAAPNIFYRTGKMYLYAFGIPYFYCESETNVDQRQAFNDREGDFYPRVSTGIPDNWLQPTWVPIQQDNTYYYNKTLSKQNVENSFTHLPLGYVAQKCQTNFTHRCVFSEDRTDDPQILIFLRILVD
jgi:hypothetical protein